MHSDNGTNFVGAERMLREAIKQLHAYKELRPFFKKKVIDWTFSPAGTPHFDDAHESYRALEKEDKTLHHPTDDMFRMILIEIAGLKNSRPLTFVSSDPKNFRPLTLNDFLNRPQPENVPVGSIDVVLPRKHYRYVQQVINLLWDKWNTNYLQSLATGKKWQTDKSLPRGYWNIVTSRRSSPEKTDLCG